MNKQIGVALIGVIVVVAIISTIISITTQQLKENFKYSKHIQFQQGALNYLYSMENWVKEMLSDKDKINASKVNEQIKIAIDNLYIENVVIQARIVDFQAKFSINNIVNFSNINNVSYYNTGRSYLDKINEQLSQEPMSIYIYNHIVNLLPNVKPFFHISELKNINGIQEKDYYAIKPYLNALPVTTAININEAQKEVLFALHPDLTDYIVDEIISIRPFNTKSQALSELQRLLFIADDDVNNELPNNLITVNSKYFVLESAITYKTNTLFARTIFYKNNDKITVMNRSYTQLK